jgi:hypothetical protein
MSVSIRRELDHRGQSITTVCYKLPSCWSWFSAPLLLWEDTVGIGSYKEIQLDFGNQSITTVCYNLLVIICLPVIVGLLRALVLSFLRNMLK